ncbi:hypothetical protein NDU88_004860 [Pleurodeles waltl]|uniref:Uncharacterized protein n=1 Tax=Pleurodeles waltl TaxID=8319 RepID=A0AAV7RM64_PLEWA|nr:hypothetical protein NDU88_004860 [Pleurodeles waltl]
MPEGHRFKFFFSFAQKALFYEAPPEIWLPWARELPAAACLTARRPPLPPPGIAMEMNRRCARCLPLAMWKWKAGVLLRVFPESPLEAVEQSCEGSWPPYA